MHKTITDIINENAYILTIVKSRMQFILLYKPASVIRFKMLQTNPIHKLSEVPFKTVQSVKPVNICLPTKMYFVFHFISYSVGN